MGFPVFCLMISVAVLVICSQWMIVCQAETDVARPAAEVSFASDDKRFRSDLSKRSAAGSEREADFRLGAGGAAEKRLSAFSGDLGKRFRFRDDLGKRFNFDLGKRFNFDLGKRYNFDLGKRHLGRPADDGPEVGDGGAMKRMFRMDLGKRSSADGAALEYPERKRVAFRADLGKRSVDGDADRKRRAAPSYDDVIGELDGDGAGSAPDPGKRFHPDLFQMDGYLNDLADYPDRAEPDKRSSFRADLGKRAYFKSDLGKRLAFNADLGKRSIYDWKRIFRTDLGR